MCKDLQGLKFAVQNVSKATSLGDEGPQRWHLHLTSFSEEIRRNSGIAFKKSVDLKLKSESRMRNGVILCIDDERIVLNGLQSQLGRDFGNLYAIELAESGEEALELIAELLATGSEIPIVISDQLMPGIKGHEVLRRIHELSPATYTVLLTGQSDLEAVTEAVNHANLYRYIAKPWEGPDLVLTVREAIKGFFQDRLLEEQNRQLERHNKELEQLVDERTQELRAEKQKSDALLLNILPDEIAAELKEKGEAKPQYYELVSVLFTDFQSFTQAAAVVNPQELVATLNECFTAFDEITGRHNLEKIKTIGDAYMCAGGLPIKNSTNPIDAVNAALEICEWVNDWNAQREQQGLPRWELRIGVNTGDLIAGVIGKKKFAYDVWGDTVNIAARMESSGEIGKVNISAHTYEWIKSHFECAHRGSLPVKGKQVMDMYFVHRPLKTNAEGNG
jgi:class 3 adenylate cyclase